MKFLCNEGKLFLVKNVNIDRKLVDIHLENGMGHFNEFFRFEFEKHSHAEELKQDFENSEYINKVNIDNYLNESGIKYNFSHNKFIFTKNKRKIIQLN